MAKHEYRILSRRTEGGLAAIVEEFLNDGWQLVGGMFVHTQPEMVPYESGFGAEKKDTTKFYQAITRVWNPQPVAIGKVVTADEERIIYSEN